MMQDSAILKGLNEQQRAAVSAPLCNALVLAGAGSGKTRVLVHRFAWLLTEEGFIPDSVLSVTFTNKAAKEMRARISVILKRSPVGLWCNTFHSMANRILHRHWEEAGLEKNFSISDSGDQLTFIRRILKQAGSVSQGMGKLSPNELRNKISGWKEEGLRSRDVVIGNHYTQEMMLEAYKLYEKTAAAESMVDFSELLLRLYELLKNKPDILAHYRRQFRCILVDEFQDTNQMQIGLIRLLQDSPDPKRPNYVMAVGDEDQSIYGWRGADIGNILRFNKLFKDVRVFRLEQNYRSTSPILEAANHLIEHNADRLGKKLWTSDRDKTPVKFYRAQTDTAEAFYVADTVREHTDSGGKPSDCAVLYRTNAQSRVLESVFVRANLPYRIYGGLRFYERTEIKDALAYMRLIVNPLDGVAFVRAINVPRRGIGAATLAKITSRAESHSLSYPVAAEQLLAENILPARAAVPLQQFLTLLEKMREEIARLTLPETVLQVIKQSGLAHYYENLEDEKDGEARKENLRELVNAASGIPIGGVAGMSAFLNTAALEAGGEREETKAQDAVQLMTLHSAKGLEFPLVFMVGMNEGLLPHENSLFKSENLEEERRLCYVGITRACRRLHMISYVLRSNGYGSEQAVSRFVEEIPEELLENVGLSGQEEEEKKEREDNSDHSDASDDHNDHDASDAPDASDASPAFEAQSNKQGAPNWALRYSAPKMKKGQGVLHPSYGYGVVTDTEGRGEGARVEVDFETEGKMWLILRYTNFQKL